MIGTKVWVFDVNHREYRRDEKGHSYGGPIWIKHWVEETIVGETSRSWILSRYSVKIPKNKKVWGVKFSWQEVEEEAWVNENHYKIIKEIESIRDYATLKKVALVIGYKGDEHETP